MARMIYVSLDVRYWQSERIYYALKKHGITDINIYHGQKIDDDNMTFITDVDTWNQLWNDIVGTFDGVANWECDPIAA